MKRSVLLPLLFLVLFVFLVGSACALTGAKETEAPEPNVIIITATPAVPTSTVAPVKTEAPVVVTEAPVVPTVSIPTEPPTETVTAAEDTTQGIKFFKDEFDNGLDNYDRFIFKADEDRIYRNNEDLEDKAGVELRDGVINFNIESYWLYYYFIYQPQVYEDVKISVEVENKGYSSSTASLICRYDENLGWYEVKIDSQGQWAMFYYDYALQKKWNRLTNGGATEFNYGKDTNKYTMVCEGREISFYINDVLSQTIEDKNLKNGKVGFSIQSPKTYTIMNVPWFEISEP